MNTIIKFRAWDGETMHLSDSGDDSAIWELSMHGLECLQPTTNWRVYPNGVEETDGWAEVPHTKYMHCSGLADQNGKDIYDGDIMQTKFSGGSILQSVVRFGNTYEMMGEDGYYGWYLETAWIKGGVEFTYVRAVQLNPSVRHTSYVAGNIYENPDLLSPALSIQSDVDSEEG